MPKTASSTTNGSAVGVGILKNLSSGRSDDFSREHVKQFENICSKPRLLLVGIAYRMTYLLYEFPRQTKVVVVVEKETPAVFVEMTATFIFLLWLAILIDR